MTLIVGLNFSDKLYLAGDTRVTRHDLKSGETVRIDNILKVTSLWGKEIRHQPFYNRDTLVMAVAGDVGFATYIYEKLEKALGCKELHSDVRILDSEIVEFVRKCTDEWLQSNLLDKGCAFLISGMTQKRKKKISKDKLLLLMEKFNKAKENNKDFRDNFINEVLPNDPTWKMLQEKTIRDSGKTVEQMLAESDIPTVGSWIDEALKNKSEEIEMPDSLIIGMDIRPGKGILNKETAEWGEFLAFGAGLSKDDLPEDIMAQIELSHVKKEKEGPDLLNGAIITRCIEDIAKERQIKSIGGTVIMMLTKANGRVYIQGKDVVYPSQPNDPFKMKLMNQTVPLISFYKYPLPKSGETTAEMSSL